MPEGIFYNAKMPSSSCIGPDTSHDTVVKKKYHYGL